VQYLFRVGGLRRSSAAKQCIIRGVKRNPRARNSLEKKVIHDVYVLEEMDGIKDVGNIDNVKIWLCDYKTLRLISMNNGRATKV
jgi:hypothetical protein